jgi:hypothetical protein
LAKTRSRPVGYLHHNSWQQRVSWLKQTAEAADTTAGNSNSKYWPRHTVQLKQQTRQRATTTAGQYTAEVEDTTAANSNSWLKHAASQLASYMQR